MKPTFVIMLACLFIAMSCEAPRRTRLPAGLDNSSNITDANGSTGTTGFTNGGTTTGGTTGSNTQNGSLPAGFENCNTNTSFYNAATGYLSICQHSSQDTSIRVQFTTTDQSEGTCFIPTYRDGSGNSTYIGNAQCSKHNDGQVMYGTLYKNRSGFSGYEINGVMVMKYSAINAYFQCMNAYGQVYNTCLPSCAVGGGYYNSTCVNSCKSNAQNYMNQICNSFKSQYGYIDASI